MAWLAGPIAGIIVQPIVGTLSDHYESRMGRRTPYILAGSFFSAVALLLFGNAVKLGKWLGDEETASSNGLETDHVARYGLVIAIASFWLLDFSLNAAQGPLRALMADIAPSEQQEQGNAFFALMTGVGNLLGNILGSIPLSKYIIFISSDICALYTIGAIMISITSSICASFAREKDSLCRTVHHQRSHYLTFTNESNELMEDANSLDLQEEIERRLESKSLKKIISNAPSPFWKLFLIQCFTWFAWFTEFVFITSWMGSEVLEGDPNAQENSEARSVFDYGVRMGNVGLSMQSLASIAYSLVLPNLIKLFGIKYCYFLAHLLLGFCLCWTPILTHIHSVLLSIICISLLGLPWASTMTIPWAILSRTIRTKVPENIGMYSTIFNLSQCFPEILVSVIAEKLLGHLNRQTMILAMGGVMAILGSLLIFTL
ncbi:sucrose transporter, GPH family [Galdieria sulphuraria]|uniref:Sucrose transporter, GPH family n=1 Tax=Galdieria sulphuraria TaxID=130081 RepID=M2WSC6_GALSU|nr:sucrose transporter, GPH family [Galdieria sulphuraria]EME26760.1 sucrose transporter, GPH family [Galdieria sulphuraria]|eukprot:XP_005703280.1 sucrose transporter, GPH family [Galdieria sulphuraria]